MFSFRLLPAIALVVVYVVVTVPPSPWQQENIKLMVSFSGTQLSVGEKSHYASVPLCASQVGCFVLGHGPPHGPFLSLQLQLTLTQLLQDRKEFS